MSFPANGEKCPKCKRAKGDSAPHAISPRVKNLTAESKRERSLSGGKTKTKKQQTRKRCYQGAQGMGHPHAPAWESPSQPAGRPRDSAAPLRLTPHPQRPRERTSPGHQAPAPDSCGTADRGPPAAPPRPLLAGAATAAPRAQSLPAPGRAARRAP